MADLSEFFARNRAWAAAMVADDPRFFSDLAHRQAPEYLWIGCSDSRVPANQIVGLRPDEHDPRIALRREPSSSDTTAAVTAHDNDVTRNSGRHLPSISPLCGGRHPGRRTTAATA